jgi:hypothetical protein
MMYFTQKDVVRLTKVRPSTLQNWINRDIVTLQKKHPGKQFKRSYTILDVVGIAAMVEMTSLKIPPTVASKALEGISRRVSQLCIGLMMKFVHDSVPKEVLPWEAKPANKLVYIFFPTDESGEWQKTEANIHEGQFYYEDSEEFWRTIEDEDYQKKSDQYYSMVRKAREKCESENEKERQEGYSDLEIANKNFPETPEIERHAVDVTEFPDCFIIFQVDKLIRRILKKIDLPDVLSSV